MENSVSEMVRVCVCVLTSCVIPMVEIVLWNWTHIGLDLGMGPRHKLIRGIMSWNEPEKHTHTHCTHNVHVYVSIIPCWYKLGCEHQAWGFTWSSCPCTMKYMHDIRACYWEQGTLPIGSAMLVHTPIYQTLKVTTLKTVNDHLIMTVTDYHAWVELQNGLQWTSDMELFTVATLVTIGDISFVEAVSYGDMFTVGDIALPQRRRAASHWSQWNELYCFLRRTYVPCAWRPGRP